jgi:hypothetical protein
MRSFPVVVIFAIIAISTASASSNSCPGAFGTPTMTLDTINSNGGCELIDKQFSNFTSTPVGQTSIMEMVSSSQTGTIGSNTITGLRADFDAPGIWTLGGNNTTTSVLNYQGAIDHSGTPPTAGTWAVSQISLFVNFSFFNASQMQSGDSVTVRMEWCPGATSVTGCSNLQFIQGVLTKLGTIQITYTNSAGDGNNFLNVASFADTTNFAVRDTLTFVGTTPSSTFPLTTVTNGFDEAGIAGVSITTPEPSTFVLFGIALAGLGGLRYRRRKIA